MSAVRRPSEARVTESPAGKPGRGRRRVPPSRNRGLFYRIRVGVLLAVLALVLVYAAWDHTARSARRAWRVPLEVALVLLERGSVDQAALDAFEERLPELEAALAREFARYGGLFSPIHFQRFGPVPERVPPPEPDPDPGLLEPARLSVALLRYARQSDAAAGVRDSWGAAYDGKIYVVLSAPRSTRRAWVEGLGQHGGRIATSHIELGEHSVDFGLFVVAHEVFHLLGARDRYGDDGATLIPEGLGDPLGEPLYPQQGAEIMARGRVLEPGREVPPAHLDELRVGAATAREIGWLPTLPP
jgi:hypothetical protein